MLHINLTIQRDKQLHVSYTGKGKVMGLSYRAVPVEQVSTEKCRSTTVRQQIKT